MLFKINNYIVQETINHYDSTMIALDKEVDSIYDKSKDSIEEAISKNVYGHEDEVTIHDIMAIHNKTVEWDVKNTEAYDRGRATISNKLRNRDYAKLINNLKMAINISVHESIYLDVEDLLNLDAIRNLGT